MPLYVPPAPQTGNPFRAGRRWVFAGDSITHGSTASNYVYAYPTQSIEMAGSLNVAPDSWEAGVPGYTSGQLLAFLPTLLALQPGGVVIAVGITDASDSNAVTLAAYQANITTMVRMVKAKGIPCVVVVPTPRSTAAATATDRARLASYALWLRLWAPGQCELADANAALSDPLTGDLLAAYNSGDGVHPNDLGHQKIAMVVSAAILRCRPTVQVATTFYAGLHQLATNPLMVTTGTAPTGSFGLAAVGTAPVLSIVADTSGFLPAGAWASMDLTAAADSIYARQLLVAATGWVPGDTFALTGYCQVTDFTGDWPALVAAGTASVSVTAYDGTHLTNLRSGFSRTTGRLVNGVWNIGPFFTPFVVPAGTAALYISYRVSAPTGKHIAGRFGAIGLLNLTALGITPGGAAMVNVAP